MTITFFDDHGFRVTMVFEETTALGMAIVAKETPAR
jgi:hypothetical protein